MNVQMKLTRKEIDRMCDVYALGPMFKKPIDAELARKGWVEDYDDESVDVAPNALQSSLFMSNGAIDPRWIE